MTQTNVLQISQEAKKASWLMKTASTEQKNKVLIELQALLSKEKHQQEILEANQVDLAEAVEKELSRPLLERLSLEGKLEGIVQELSQVIALEDPVGKVFEERTLANGMHLLRQRVPIGVLGVIYESRPNVTIDVSALAIKSGNAAILRGGSETLHTNQVLARLIQKSLAAADLPPQAVQLIASSDRAHVTELLHLHEQVDLIIPRGSASLQQFCLENSQIPVITGGIGICHLFVDETADLKQSLQVILNAKTQRPTVCNALDTLLVHESIAKTFIPQVVACLKEKGVSFRLDPKDFVLVSGPLCTQAVEEDWRTEWLSLVLGIKRVESIEEAIAHIQKYGTGHSDGILTETRDHAERFIKEIDSAAVYVNASTRFTDGGQFGLGAEVAVSTQKIHARGPMGLQELTSYKWVCKGNYHIRN